MAGWNAAIKQFYGEVVGAVVAGGALLCKIVQRIKVVTGIEAFLILLGWLSPAEFAVRYV